MNLKQVFRRLFSEFFVRLPITKKHGMHGITVSLTSYTARMPTLHIVIRSLLHQTVRAERIVLYLGKDTPNSYINNKLKKLTKYGLVIKTGYEDLKPHKKYFFAMQEYSEDIIITVDDDLIYDRSLIHDLLECSHSNPRCVCARRVNLLTRNSISLNPYSDWKWEYREITYPSHSLIATGCGGILYPAHCFGPETFDITAIKNVCLNTDDIWLKFFELKNDIKVVFTNSKIIHPLTIRRSQKSALMNTNTCGENQNDINIKKMEEFTNINLMDFAEMVTKKI